MTNFGSVILIEVVLVFGGAFLFAWWQLRDLKKSEKKPRKIEKIELYPLLLEEMSTAVTLAHS